MALCKGAGRRGRPHQDGMSNPIAQQVAEIGDTPAAAAEPSASDAAVTLALSQLVGSSTELASLKDLGAKSAFRDRLPHGPILSLSTK